MAEVNSINSSSTNISRFNLRVNSSSASSLSLNEGSVSQSSSTPPEIVVVGNPSLGYDFTWPTSQFLPGVQLGPPGNFSSTDPYMPYTQAWSIKLSNIHFRLQQIITKIKTELAKKDPQAKFSVTFRDKLGVKKTISITYKDISKMMDSFSYNFVINMKLAEGYGGFTACKDGRCYSNIDTQTILNYEKSYTSNKDMDVTYYALHELVHNFKEMKNYENNTSADWYRSTNATTFATPAWAKSSHFSSIEAAANTLAKDLATSLGLTMPTNPSHGYLPPN